MQMASKDFVAQASDEEIAAFGAGHELASLSLATIAGSIDAVQRDDIVTSRQALGEMKLNFDALVQEQRDLGYSPTEGTRKLLEESNATDTLEAGWRPLLRAAKNNPVNYHLVGHIIRTSCYPIPWLLGVRPGLKPACGK